MGNMDEARAREIVGAKNAKLRYGYARFNEARGYLSGLEDERRRKDARIAELEAVNAHRQKLNEHYAGEVGRLLNELASHDEAVAALAAEKERNGTLVDIAVIRELESDDDTDGGKPGSGEEGK